MVHVIFSCFSVDFLDVAIHSCCEFGFCENQDVRFGVMYHDLDSWPRGHDASTVLGGYLYVVLWLCVGGCSLM